MRRGWISIEEFKMWEEGRGVLHAVLNFPERLEDYKKTYRLSVNPSYLLSNASFVDYIMSRFPDFEERGGLGFIERHCGEVYSELSSLSKLSSLEWLCIGMANEFLSTLPDYSRNFNTFYQTYSVIVSSIRGSNLHAMGARQINFIIENLLELPLYAGMIFDEELKEKLIQTGGKVLNNIKEMRSLELATREDLDGLAPDSFSSFYFTMQYMFQKIVMGADPRGLLYRRTPLNDPEHLQNSMVKVWRIIHNNKDLHRDVHGLFIDISRQGRGPVAADVVRVPIGAILAYAVVQVVELKEGSIHIPTAMSDKKSYLQDLYFRLSIRLDRYNLSEDLLAEMLDEELSGNNDIVTKKLLNDLMSIQDCHFRVRNSIFRRDEQPLVRALIVGDSVAAGFGVNEEIPFEDGVGGIYTYPKRAAAMITNHAVENVVIANASLVGSVTADGASSIGAMLDVHNPHIVVLTQGGNDTILAGLSISGSTGENVNKLLSNMRRNFEKMIKECLRRNPETVIILSLKIPEDGFFLLHKEVNANLFEAVLQPLQAKYPNVQITDLPEEPFAFDPDMRLPDKIHLTEGANKILAEHMITTLGMVGERVVMAKSSGNEMTRSPRTLYEIKCSKSIGNIGSETTRIICGDEDVNIEGVMDELEYGVTPVVPRERVDPYGIAMLGALRKDFVSRRCRA